MVLFNDAFNTFYIRIYGVGLNGKGSQNERERAGNSWATLSDYVVAYIYFRANIHLRFKHDILGPHTPQSRTVS